MPSSMGPLPWQRPLVDVSDGRVLGYELCSPPDGTRPGQPGDGRGQPQSLPDFGWRRDWVIAAQRAGLAVAGHWLLVPVDPGAADRPPEALERLLSEQRALGSGTALSSIRVAIQFDAALHAEDVALSRSLIRVFRAQGFAIAINGFGDGFESGQDLLDAAPDLLRLSPSLTRGVEQDRHRRSIVAALAGMARDLDIGLIADQVDSTALAARLLALGVRMQTGRVHGEPAPLPLPSP